MKVEVRAIGLKAARSVVSPSVSSPMTSASARITFPPVEANSRQAGPKLQDQLVKYFGCRFEDLFEVVLVNLEAGSEQRLEAARAKQQ